MERPTKQQVPRLERQESFTDGYATADFSLPPLRPPGKPAPMFSVHLPPVKMPTKQTPVPPSSSSASPPSQPIRGTNKHRLASSPMPNPVFLPPLNIPGKKTGGKCCTLPPPNAAVRQTEAIQEVFYIQVSSPRAER
ncbi:hypothetical protein JRQ81_019836 [Phrynocephalus forsythii]|uniref:Uncharacterized protein n=1 Tax=Phrynocephalus forsythii TaxID=171643 RepID=A0A9Q0XQ61_9SAUR|nr:hypothetical protein JRQ81_019836 [Phrynocephalus forsythii]